MSEAIFAEYSSVDHLVAAISYLRDAGYGAFETMVPYHDPEIQEAMGRRRSRLPFVMFLGGVAGAATAYFIEWWTVAKLYPLDVGGRPEHSPLAFLVIAFEMGVLSSVLTGFVALAIKARFLDLYDPMWDVPGIQRSSIDRYWLRLDCSNEPREADAAATRIVETHPLSVFRDMRGIV